jgi:hypothetical protein
MLSLTDFFGLGENKSPYEYYLELLGSWPTSISLASQWLVYFDFSSVNSMMNNLQSTLRKREYGNNWTYNSSVTRYLLDGKLQYSTNNMVGCAFARQVQLPSETIAGGNEGLEYGGFMPPATVGNREKYQNLSVTMLETNASFLDLILRPWIVSVGYNGLVARNKNSEKYVKCNFADVVMYAKTGPNRKMAVRKIYRFFNVAPISIPGETYSYSEEGMKYSDVKFVYDRYSVLDGQTGNYMYLK